METVDDDQVFCAAGDDNLTVEEIAKIAGIEPTAIRHHARSLFGRAKIATHQAWASHENATHLSVRQRVARFTANLDVVMGEDTAAEDESACARILALRRHRVVRGF